MNEKTASGPRSELGHRWIKYEEDMREYIRSKNPSLKKHLDTETWELFCLETAHLTNRRLGFVPAGYGDNKADFVHSVALSFLAREKNDIKALVEERDEHDAALFTSLRTWVNQRLWWFMQDKLKKQSRQSGRGAKQANKAASETGEAPEKERESEEGVAVGVGDAPFSWMKVSMEDEVEGDIALSDDYREEIDNRIFIAEILQRANLDDTDTRILCLRVMDMPRKEAAAELGMEEGQYKWRWEKLVEKLRKALP